jgi:glycosyltransferase involved in cell wall biosynthesis
MEKCRVGIITPSFNKHHFLNQAIDSVLAQTHADFSHFIVNDYAGKPDAEIVRDDLDTLVKSKGDDRIEVFHNEANIGISKSRNSMIRRCKELGLKYVFFLDHDDIWSDPDKLKHQLWVFSEGDIWLLWTQFDIIDASGKPIWMSRNPISNLEIFQSLMLSCPILMSSMWVRMGVFDAVWLLDEELNGSDDWEFLIRSLKRFKGENLPDFMTQYRSFGLNTSQTEWHRLIREQIKIIRKEWPNLNWFHRWLALAHMRLMIPLKAKPYARKLKKFITPRYDNLIMSRVREDV